jgi:hypothetical protein
MSRNAQAHDVESTDKRKEAVLPRTSCFIFLDEIMTASHPLSVKVGTTFADMRRSLGQYSSLAD